MSDQQPEQQGAGGSEAYDPAKDPKRKAKSKDPAWKYCYWPDLNKKDVVKCTLCGKVVHAGVRRLKQHLVGGHGDVAKCPKTTSAISKEMQDYLKRNARQKPIELDDDKEGNKEDEVEVVEQGESGASHSVVQPSSGTALKRKISLEASQSNQPASKASRSIAEMFRKAPEDVVRERHTKGNTQTTLERKSKEEKEKTDMYVADFIYDTGLPLNVINSRSFEIMLEAVGQYGPGYVKPSYHEVRVPLLEKAKKSVDDIKKTHERAWAEFGCTLMSDSWTDRRGRHLINFLANSPAGTFFLESVNASSETADAQMLAALFEKRIEDIGRDKVVQIVTDNGANFKAAGRLLERRFPHLFWTPCAAHCLDLMLEDIGKIGEFKKCISRARQVTTFIYRHGKLLAAVREKLGGDLVRPAVTRFATSFLTLQSIMRHMQHLKELFVSEDWHRSKLSITEAGKKVQDILLSNNFWNSVRDCIRASQSLLIVLRIVDGDEKPAMPEVAAAMEMAKAKITSNFEGREAMKQKLLAIINRRWQDQMEVKLYGAALFLNPNKFFELQRSDPTKREVGRLRAAFNEVLWKTVEDDELLCKISKQADDYMGMAGPAFSSPLAIKEQQKKSPIRWWDAYGGLAFEIQSFAKRIVSLCCSASGCERNWSTFEFIHTKKRNRLEHQRLNNLVYIQYNRKMAARFQRLREEGNIGNPLILEDFQWDNEWVDNQNERVREGDDLEWAHVDEAIGASSSLQGRNFPRRARFESVYSRRSRAATTQEEEIMGEEEQGNDQEDEEYMPNDDEEVDDFGESPHSSPTQAGGEENAIDDLELGDI